MLWKSQLRKGHWPMSKESLSVKVVDLYLALNVDLRESTRLGAFEKLASLAGQEKDGAVITLFE